MHLLTPLTFGPGVTSIALPGQGAGTPPDVPATVSGWGALNEGGPGSPTLRYVVVPIITNADCNTAYSGGITDGMICAGFQGEGIFLFC